MSDWFQNQSGQYHDLGNGASYGEQSVAGVGWGDSPQSAAAKVWLHRTAYGLDPNTGQPTAQMPGASGGAQWTGEDVESCCSALVRVLLFAMLFVAVLVVLFALVAAFGYANYRFQIQDPRGGLSSVLVRKIAPGAKLSPPSAYAPISPPRARGSRPLAKSGSRRIADSGLREADLFKAYTCQVDRACAIAAYWRSNGTLADAGAFLILKAKAGRSDAAREACLLPLLTFAIRGIDEARRLCGQAALAAPTSDAPALARELNGSWLARLGNAAEWATEATDVPVMAAGKADFGPWLRGAPAAARPISAARPQ